MGAACTDAGGSVVILQNAQAGGDCSGNDLSSFIGQGVIDVATDRGYIMRPVLQNQAISEVMGASRRAQLEGYNVDISYPGSGSCSTDSALTSFSRLVGASIEAGGTSVVAIELLPIEFLETCTVSGNNVIDIVAEVQFFGTMDGGDLESTKFRYPVQVCSGCLAEDLGMCSELTGSEEISGGSSCNPYQDLPVSCCTDSGGQTVCPAVREIITP
jgi:hypothetical protein